MVWASYGVATVYVTADAMDKGKKAAAAITLPIARVSSAHCTPATPVVCPGACGLACKLPKAALLHAVALGGLMEHGDGTGKTARVAVAMVDTFVWQALASVVIPGFTINRVCAASLYMLGLTTRWPLPVLKWTTTAIGLTTIPFIIKPIDR
ncbi:MTFP1 protein, partial [Polyodon spathula]|nr:MTFP1 protein [Polyodon spathula]